MRQAEMKQVQTMPTAAIRQVENCLLLLHGRCDEDPAAKGRQRDSHACFSHQEQRVEYQRNKYPPWPFFSIAGPSSFSLWFPALFSFLGTAEEHLCMPKQPASTCPGPACTVPFLLFKGLLGPPRKTGNTDKTVLTIVSLSLSFLHMPESWGTWQKR